MKTGINYKTFCAHILLCMYLTFCCLCHWFHLMLKVQKLWLHT